MLPRSGGGRDRTGAAGAILGLDIPDLDLPGKRGRVISKGRNDRLGALADRHRHAARLLIGGARAPSS